MAEDERTRNDISGTVHADAVQAGSVGAVYQGGVHVHPAQPVRWPCRVGVAPLRADCFQQRPLGTTLANTVGAGETAVLTQVLAGLGGVGKTQLATKFAEDRWAAGELDLLVWITAASREAIVSGYAATASKIGLTPSDGDEDHASQRFLEWLGETDRRWLVVLDDVQEPSDVHRLWPPQRTTGRVVVTTRRRDAALSGQGRRMLDVGLFSPQEALAYVQAKLADQPELAEGAEELAADVGFLPLALAQAAAYLADRQITCTDYRHRLADQRRRLDQLVPEAGSLPDDQHSPLAATWSMSVELADQLAPAGLARPLLELAAVLDPNGIPAEIFTTSAVQDYLTTRHPISEPVDTDEVWDALRGLHRLSLATVDTANPHRSVRVHALVQRATREQHHPNHRPADLAHAAADALLEAWPDVERDTTHGQTLRANTDHLHTNTGTHLWTPAFHLVLFRAGTSRGEAGHVTDATTYFHHLHTQTTHTLGPDHPDTLATRSHLAFWRGEAGDAAGAAAAFEKLLTVYERVLGPDYPHTLITRNNLASWRGQAGDAAGAAAAFEELLADQVRVLGPDHPDTLTTRHNLAFGRGEAGDAAGAAAGFEELLVDRIRVLGPDHPHTLITRNNLARSRGKTGDAAGAAVAFEELLNDQVRVLGPDHPDTLATRSNLARSRGEAGDAAGAAAAFKELLADQVRVLGPDHPHTLITRNNLASWRGEAGDAAGAAAAFEKLLTVYERVLGPDHPHTLITRHNLACWRGEAGDAAGAAVAFEELLADRVRVLGPGHPYTLTTRSSLACWRGKTGDAAGAAVAFEELLADQVRVLGPDHPETLTTRKNLAFWRGQASDD